MIHNMRRPVPALLVSPGQREILESVARSPSAPHREVVRARALLMAADGLANTAIAAALSVSPASVSGWRTRFAEEGLVKFAQVREGRGRKKAIPQEKIDEIVDLTLNYRPEGETHWSCRTLAAATGGVEIDCAAGVVGAGPQTAPGRDVQAVQRSEVRGESWSMSSGFI